MLQAADPDDARKLLPAFFLTEADPNSVSYVPAGYFLLDVTVGSEMVSGFRASLLVMNDRQIVDLKAVVQTFEHAGRDAGLMASMIRSLSNQGGYVTMGLPDIKKEEDDAVDKEVEQDLALLNEALKAEESSAVAGEPPAAENTAAADGVAAEPEIEKPEPEKHFEAEAEATENAAANAVDSSSEAVADERKNAAGSKDTEAPKIFCQ